jgi:hypothetical protein
MEWWIGDLCPPAEIMDDPAPPHRAVLPGNTHTPTPAVPPQPHPAVTPSNLLRIPEPKPNLTPGPGPAVSRDSV